MILLAGACSSDDSDSSPDSTEGTEETSAVSEEVLAECEKRDEAEEPAEEEAGPGALDEVMARGEPEVAPRESPEEGSTVLIPGEGEDVIANGSVDIHTVFYVASSGEVFDSSWDQGEPNTVNLTEVFPEFSEAVADQKVGARVEIVVPVSSIYENGAPAEAPFTDDDFLIFVIDIVNTGEPDSLADEEAVAAAEERGEPEVEVPDEVPTELVIIDDVEGEGDIVCPGDTVVAHYKGVGMNTGQVFDSSWDRDEPASFPLDGVIRGWTEGLPGMHVGGRRTLVIPADMAYGDTPQDGSGIEPGEALVFTVDMVGAG